MLIQQALVFTDEMKGYVTRQEHREHQFPSQAFSSSSYQLEVLLLLNRCRKTSMTQPGDYSDVLKQSNVKLFCSINMRKN